MKYFQVVGAFVTIITDTGVFVLNIPPNQNSDSVNHVGGELWRRRQNGPW